MTWLVDLILKLFAMWLNRTPSSISEAEKAGAAQAEVKMERDDAVDVEKAAAAEAAARVADAGAASLRRPSDSDCRDCQA